VGDVDNPGSPAGLPPPSHSGIVILNLPPPVSGIMLVVGKAFEFGGDNNEFAKFANVL